MIHGKFTVHQRELSQTIARKLEGTDEWGWMASGYTALRLRAGVLRSGSKVLARRVAEEDAENRDHGRTQSSRPGTTHTWHIVSTQKVACRIESLFSGAKRDRRGLSFGNCIKGRRVCREGVKGLGLAAQATSA